MTTAPNGADASLPLLVWDGDCGFCRRSMLWLQRRCGPHRLRQAPWQEALPADPDLPLEEDECRQAVQLVEVDRDAPADDERADEDLEQVRPRATEAAAADGYFDDDRYLVYSGAAAVYRALSHAPGHGVWWFLYRRLPGFGEASEFLYRRVAHNRALFGGALRLLAGPDPHPPTFVRARRVFAAVLGFALVAACVSAALQLPGLIGPDGIWPVAVSLRDLAARPALHAVPTVFHLGQSNAWLLATALAGAAFGVLAAFGIAARWTLLLGWVAYLSIVDVGYLFFDMPGDRSLLEAALLGALFVLPNGISRRAWQREPSAIGVFLLRLLLLRMTFFSALGKLVVGGPVWQNFDGFELWLLTQPLPHAGSAWLAEALATPTLRWLAFVGVVIELVAPWLVLLGPRRLRALGGIALLALQVAAYASGNPGLRPLVVVALVAFAFDDRMLRLARVFAGPVHPGRLEVWPKLAFAVLVVLLAAVDQVRVLRGGTIGLAVGPRLLAQDLHVGIGYPIWPTVATERYRLLVEVRDVDDARARWQQLTPRHAAGVDGRRSPFLGPHVPRLAVQMSTFARQVPMYLQAWQAGADLALPRWLHDPTPGDVSLTRRLLQDSESVFALFGADPPDDGVELVRIRCAEQRWAPGELDRSLQSSNALDFLLPHRLDADGRVVRAP